METDNNNLGDFFRKRLNNPDEPNQEWNTPDKGIRLEVLNKITTSEKLPFFKYKTILYSAAAAIILIGMTSLLFSLNNKNNQLNNQLITQKNESKKIIKSLKNDLINTQIEQTKQINEVNALQLKYNQLASLASKQSIENSAQEKTIALLKYEKKLDYQLINNQLLTSKSAQMENTPQMSISPIIDAQLHHSKIRKDNIVATSPIIPISPLTSPDIDLLDFIAPLPVIKKKINRPEFGVGYKHTFSSFSAPIKRSFRKQQVYSNNNQSNNTQISQHGFNLQYSPLKNLWLTSGLKKGNFIVQNEYQMGLSYNTDNETNLSNNQIKNEFLLNTSAIGVDINSSFDVTFDQGHHAHEGDLIKIKIEDQFTVDLLQIPMGAAYFVGNKQLKWMIQAGLIWNQMKISDYSFNSDIYASQNHHLTVSNEKTLGQEISTKKYTSIYSGLGIDYQPFGNIHLQMAINYDYRFNQETNTSTNIELGMNYLF